MGDWICYMIRYMGDWICYKICYMGDWICYMICCMVGRICSMICYIDLLLRTAMMMMIDIAFVFVFFAAAVIARTANLRMQFESAGSFAQF